MKTRPVCRLRSFLLITVGLGGFAASSLAADPTAFELFREGNRYVGEEAKNRLVEIRSEKSVGSLTPTIWYVVYFDPNSKGKGTEVKFAAGQKVAVKHWGSFLGMAKTPTELPKDKLKIDSDQALKTATSEPLLKNLTLKATRLTLEHWEGLPAWRVRLWAAKLQKPDEMAEVGEVFVNVEDGKVLRSDIKIKRVD
ncbi:MAG: hypothetical protein HZA90_20240 [Verrucomicrobia bacterium]|nr:hypothetical protein [Verrucomicrobiota bacterium]